MAEVNCETMEITGEDKVVIYLSPSEVDLIVSTWGMPIEFKHLLLEAKKVCEVLTND